MASMTRKERAESYLKRILTATNREAESTKILEELNGLIYSSNNEPLSEQDKLLIIEVIEELHTNPLVEKSKSLEQIQIAEASDNSGVLDIIEALRRGVKN